MNPFLVRESAISVFSVFLILTPKVFVSMSDFCFCVFLSSTLACTIGRPAPLRSGEQFDLKPLDGDEQETIKATRVIADRALAACLRIQARILSTNQLQRFMKKVGRKSRKADAGASAGAGASSQTDSSNLSRSSSAKVDSGADKVAAAKQVVAKPRAGRRASTVTFALPIAHSSTVQLSGPIGAHADADSKEDEDEAARKKQEQEEEEQEEQEEAVEVAHEQGESSSASSVPSSLRYPECEVTIGVHAGWAIECAIGSQFKARRGLA
jgi:hypothetical protein